MIEWRNWRLVATARVELIALVIGVATLARPAEAVTRHVRHWGVDSGTCGGMTAPCRSIGKAVSLSISGDTVLVGPGQYSRDLDGDSVYNEPGEEPFGGIVIGSGVVLKSTHGASATRIEYIGSLSSVLIANPNAAVIGKRNHGFTIFVKGTNTSTLFYAIDCRLGCSTSVNVIFMDVSGGQTAGIACSGVTRDNRVVNLSPSSVSAGIVGSGIFERNVVIGATWGIIASDTPTALRRNVALE